MGMNFVGQYLSSCPSKDSSKKFFLKWGQDEMSFQEPSHLTNKSAFGNKELVSTITSTQLVISTDTSH